MSDRCVFADWQTQSAVWLTWPHNRETWPGRFDAIEPVYRKLISAIAPITNVCVLADQKTIEVESANFADCVRWFPVKTNDCWIRDYGPTFVGDRTGQLLRAIKWRYNAWGEKYPPWEDDDAAGETIAELAGVFCVKSELCVEGGALEWDGMGRLLTTTSCLVTNSRNPGWSKRDIEEHLKELTGTHEIVWVDGGGLEGDDTDGHIDQLARFVDEKNIVAAICEDPNDPNAEGLRENIRQLELWGNKTNPKVEVHRLPIPPARFINDQRVPESYCNFLRLGPSDILVPTFVSEPTDQKAIGLIKNLACKTQSNPRVLGFDCSDLVWGLGALHCASLNQPMPRCDA